MTEDNIRLPIVEHVDKLKAVLDELEKVRINLTEVVQNQKDVIYQTRIDVATIERMEKESSGSSMKSLLEDTARLEKEFRKLSEIEAGSPLTQSAETGFLKNQIQQLNNEKFKNNQNVAVLAERVRSSELEIGMKHYMG